jgi:hypothetical protein
MPLTSAPLYCMQWSCQQIEAHESYILNVGAVRQLYYCPDCKSYFSETQTTPLAHLKLYLSFGAFVERPIVEFHIDGAGRSPGARVNW